MPDHGEVIARLEQATAGLDTPFAALDLTTLRENAADLARRAAGRPIRVASKSVRCRAVLEDVLGPDLTARGGYRGIMTFALAEAIWLARAGARDIVMGYPTVDRTALRELDADLRSRIVLMIDDVAQLDLLPTGARICLDVDASLRVGPLHLGARRSPVHTADEAAALAAAAAGRGFAVVGVMTYEAQIAGLPDSSLPIRLMKQASAKEIGQRRVEVVEAVRSVVGELDIVNSGGTGSIEVSIADSGVTEVTAGSGLYVPTLFDDYRSFRPHPAMYFATSVVRKPTDDIATVFGGGYIASGPPGRSRVPTPTWPPGLSLVAGEAAGEVQTPVRGARELSVGDRVWFRHAKAGELCERFMEVHLVEVDGSRRTVPTYRGEGRCFG